MSKVTYKGNPVQLRGQFPSTGSRAPDFSLVDNDLNDKNLASFAGRRKVLNIFPSIDTDVCATSVRRFNELAGQMDNTEVLCISADLPFAQARFCGAEGLERVHMVSAMRRGGFVQDCRVELAVSPLAGLAARGGVVVDAANTVLDA